MAEPPVSGVAALDRLAKQTEKSLGLPQGFLGELSLEDDWSLVIKGHALLEAAASHLLSVATGNGKLEPLFAKMPMNNSQTGKVRALSLIGELSGPEKRFVSWFSALRNSLVHRVENTRFVVTDYYSKLDPNKRREFWEATLHFISDDEGAGEWREESDAGIQRALYAGMLSLTIFLVFRAESHRSRAESNRKGLDRLEQLAKIFGPPGAGPASEDGDLEE